MNKKIRIVLFIFVFLCSSAFIYTQDMPKPVGYVNDFAGVIDSDSENKMTALIGAIEDKTDAEIAVVTITSIEPYATINEYAIELASQWGIGKKGDDTGILFLLAMKERQVRIDVGYGFEGIIPDGLAGEILDKSILPSFRTGDYGTGFLNGVGAVAGIIAKDRGIDLSAYNIKESSQYTKKSNSIGSIFYIIVIIFMFGGGRFFLPLLFFMPGRRGFYGGGFGSSSSGRTSTGFGGGGFSGFGGGGFGGGGASRGF